MSAHKLGHVMRRQFAQILLAVSFAVAWKALTGMESLNAEPRCCFLMRGLKVYRNNQRKKLNCSFDILLRFTLFAYDHQKSSGSPFFVHKIPLDLWKRPRSFNGKMLTQ